MSYAGCLFLGAHDRGAATEDKRLEQSCGNHRNAILQTSGRLAATLELNKDVRLKNRSASSKTTAREQLQGIVGLEDGSRPATITVDPLQIPRTPTTVISDVASPKIGGVPKCLILGE